MFNAPTEDQFRNTINNLPAFVLGMIEMGFEYDYEMIWDWVCDQCNSEGLYEDQVAVLDTIHDIITGKLILNLDENVRD
jgi:hypothetical protein